MASLTHQKKHIKRKNNDFILKIESENQEYAEVIAAKGGSRFDVRVIKNNEIINAKLRGTLSHGPGKQRIDKNNYVLIHLDKSTTDGNKYYIIHKYSPEDVKKLHKMGQLAQIKSNDTCDDDDFFETDIVAKKLDEIIINEDFINNI
jgi:hypothetical protein